MSKLYYYNDGQFSLTTFGIICTIILIVILVLVSIWAFAHAKSHEPASQSKDKNSDRCNSQKTENRYSKGMGVRQLAFSGIAMSLGVITSEMIPTFSLPFGGSVTLFSMLFIALIGYWYGILPGLLTGIAYGFLQFVLDPKFISPMQILLDYIFAFGALGLSGIFSKMKNGIIPGYIAGVIGRYIFAVISGATVWAEYYDSYDGFADGLIYSLSYNAFYIIPEMVITIAILAVPSVRKAMQRIKNVAING